MIAFGLDIAGLSGRNNAGLAAVSRKADAATLHAWVVRRNTFGIARDGTQQLREFVDEQCELLAQMGRVGPVLIDTVLDTQGLDVPDQSKYIWQLLFRPVDYAYGAISIYAGLIGAVYAYVRLLRTDPRIPQLADRLWETYPKGSLVEMNLPTGLYKPNQGRLALPAALTEIPRWKDQATVLEERLDAIGEAKLGAAKGSRKREEFEEERKQVERELTATRRELNPLLILQALAISPADDEAAAGITGDELDAIICALPRIVNDDERLEDTDSEKPLSERIKRLIREIPGMSDYAGPHAAPRGYVLAKSYSSIVKTELHIIEERGFRRMLDSPEQFYCGT